MWIRLSWNGLTFVFSSKGSEDAGTALSTVQVRPVVKASPRPVRYPQRLVALLETLGWP